jgi:nucleotide-binding universal stress UspA family protein
MKVLVAIDNSECSSAAVNAVADRSWPSATVFEIITVVEPLAAQYCYAGACSMDSLIEVERQIVEHCQQLVDGKVSQLAAIFGKGRVSGKVIEGGIADSIIDHADQWQADLIVVGSHGRKGIKRFLLGSIAGKVASHAPCSIEIVKNKVAHTEIQPADEKETMILVAHH